MRRFGGVGDPRRTWRLWPVRQLWPVSDRATPPTELWPVSDRATPPTELWPVSDRATPPTEGLLTPGKTCGPTFRRGRRPAELGDPAELEYEVLSTEYPVLHSEISDLKSLNPYSLTFRRSHTPAPASAAAISRTTVPGSGTGAGLPAAGAAEGPLLVITPV